MNKIKLILLIINAVTISLFFNSIYTFKERSNIISLNKPINPSEYTVINFNCWHGSRGSSSIEIEFKNEKYSVGLNTNECDNWKEINKDVRLFYNSKSNNIFTVSGLSNRMIYGFGIISMLFLGIWIIPKKYWNK